MRRDGVRPGFQQLQRLADSVVVSDGHQIGLPCDALTSACLIASIPSISARKLPEQFRSRVKCRAMSRAADLFWNSGIKRSVSTADRLSASRSRNLACRPRFCSPGLSNASARETNGQQSVEQHLHGALLKQAHDSAHSDPASLNRPCVHKTPGRCPSAHRSRSNLLFETRRIVVKPCSFASQ